MNASSFSRRTGDRRRYPCGTEYASILPTVSRHMLKCLTGAQRDRLTHHVHILTMNGDGYRLKQSSGRRRSQAPENTTELFQSIPLLPRHIGPSEPCRVRGASHAWLKTHELGKSVSDLYQVALAR